MPQGTDPILQSYSQLKSNFQAIDAAFSDNHVGLTNTTDLVGKHNILTLQPQTLDPATSATQVALYNKLDGSSIPQMFFRPSNNLTPIQMTYTSLQTGMNTTTTYFPEQYTFSAGPFIIYGGIIVKPSDGDTKTLTPGTTLIYVDLIATNSTIKVTGAPGNIPPFAYAIPTNITGTTFTIRFDPNANEKMDLYYFAIGLQ